MVGAIEGNVADNDRQAEYLWTLRAVRDAGGDGILESTLMKMVRGRWDKRRHDDFIGQMAAAGLVWREIRTPAGGGRPGMRIGMWREGEREAG